MKILPVFIATISLFILTSLGHTATPPPTSPLAKGEHPRIFFTASQLPALRDRIATYYQTEFQDFITLLDDPSVFFINDTRKEIENSWGGLNYAFIAALDPQEMQQRGFTFSPALDTSQEYCDKSIGYVKNMLGAISSGGTEGESFGSGYSALTYMPVIPTYDWCFSYLSDADKKDWADAWISAYENDYQGKDLINAEFPGSSFKMAANSRVSNDVADILGIVAFYGDSYPDSALQAEMYDAFYTIWVDRVLVELNYFYGSGSGWHGGPGGYFTGNSFPDFLIPFAMFSSALGTNYVTTTPFFYTFPLWVEANVKPHSLNSGCGSSGTEPCPEYFERWGTMSGGYGSLKRAACKSTMLISGILREANHPYASIAKWSHTQTASDSCSDAITIYGGDWQNAVLFEFLYGNKEISEQDPDQSNLLKTQKLGLGEYVMKTGYGADDSQVVFWASEFNMYGHDSPEYGPFTIHKYGNLILRVANSKSGDAEIDKSKLNIFTNTIGIHKGSSDADLDWNNWVVDPFFEARGINKIGTAGILLAEKINNQDFDYIAYDNSPSWDPVTADVSQREFVYLRGPLDKEYVVVFDRINVINPSTDEKIWKIWVPAQPVFENGNPSSPRTGKWTSTNTNIISMTNKFSSLETPNFDSASTHGKFFMKTLSPDNFEIKVLGGPGKEFQSGDDDGSTPWGSPSMTQGMHEYLGWGRIEVLPTIAKNYDVFLNVIQFGDSDTLSAMSPVVKLESAQADMLGTHIQDTTRQWIVMFSKNASDLFKISSTSYLFKPSAGDSKHILLDMEPSKTFYISQSSDSFGTTVTVSTSPQTGATTVSSSESGVLNFDLNGSTNGDTTPPANPNNLQVN